MKENKNPHWSYSSFNCYMECPMKYYFRYIEKAPVERTGSCLPLGRAFHGVLSQRALQGAAFTLSEGRISTPESGSGLRFYYGREGMRKNRHVWADRDEHVTVHRSGGGRGGSSDTSGWTLLLWGTGIIAVIILLYYLWDVIQILIVLAILGGATRLLVRK